MLVYILFGVAIAFCIGADYLVNRKRREEDDPFHLTQRDINAAIDHHSRVIVPPMFLSKSELSGELEIIKVNRVVNSGNGITSAKQGKPTRNHRWTEKEKQFLVNNFKEISAKNIAKCKEMGGRHSVNAIYKMAARLGLSSHNPFNDKEHNELLTEKLRTESNQE